MSFLARVRTACATLAVLPSIGFAQGTAGHPTLGIQGGWSRSDLHGPEIPGPLHTNGGAGGVYVRWRLTDRLDLQPEVQYVQKGNRQVNAYWAGTYAMRIRLGYVEVPLLARAHGSTMAGRYTPYLLAGPEVAFRTTCGLTVRGLTGSYSCDDLPEARTFDYGVIVGGGVDVDALGRQFTLSVRYDQGLVDVFTSGDPKNRALTVLVGVPLSRTP